MSSILNVLANLNDYEWNYLEQQKIRKYYIYLNKACQETLTYSQKKRKNWFVTATTYSFLS